MVFGMHLHGAHSGQDAVVASAEKQTINNLQQAAVDQVAHNSIKKVTSADSDRDSGSVHLHEHSVYGRHSHMLISISPEQCCASSCSSMPSSPLPSPGTPQEVASPPAQSHHLHFPHHHHFRN